MSSSSNALRELRASLTLLRSRRFGTFWTASLLSNLGMWAQQVAEPWLLLTLGASSFVVGLDSFAMNAPVWALTLVGGVLADRRDRRRVIFLFQSVQLLCPIAIVVLLVEGRVRPWMVIALSGVVGVTDALSMPSFQSIVPSIVDHEQIDRGLALNATQFNLSRILGPALAGVLMATVGAIWCFALNAVSYLPFIAVALWILPRRVPAAHDTFERRGIVRSLRDIVRTRSVGGALATVLTTSTLCAPLVTFVPVLVKDAFRGDATTFSTAIGSFGIGGLLGAFGLLAFRNRQLRRRSVVFGAAFGVIVAVSAIVPWTWLLPILMALAGVAMTVSNISASSLLQETAKPELLGRTVSLFMLAMRGGLSLGSLVTGYAADALGVRGALLLDGMLAVAIHLALGRASLRSSPPTRE